MRIPHSIGVFLISVNQWGLVFQNSPIDSVLLDALHRVLRTCYQLSVMKYFSVRNLLFLLSAVISLLLATAYYQGSRWRRTVDELQTQGVHVEVVEPEWYQQLPSSFRNEWIRSFFRGQVVFIHYENCRKFNDHIIQLTVDLGDIESLYLYYTGIDDESLRKIVSNNSSLSTILIFDTPVTCDSVRYLKKRYPGIRIGTSLECEP